MGLWKTFLVPHWSKKKADPKFPGRLFDEATALTEYWPDRCRMCQISLRFRTGRPENDRTGLPVRTWNCRT